MKVQTTLTPSALRLLELLESRGELGVPYREALTYVGSKASMSRATRELRDEELIRRENGFYFLADTGTEEPEVEPPRPVALKERVAYALRNPGPELDEALSAWGREENLGTPVVREVLRQIGEDPRQARESLHLVFPHLFDSDDSLGLRSQYRGHVR